MKQIDWDKVSFNTAISSDDYNAVCQLLSTAYWVKGRSKEQIIKSIQSSLCFTVFYEKKLVGFARVITDYSTVFYLCDVIIDTDYRGNGLGKLMMDKVMNCPQIADLHGVVIDRTCSWLLC